MRWWQGWLRDAAGSVADLGVLIPIAGTLIVHNGLDAGTVLVGAGTLYLVAGLYFRVPVPVQPIKAAAAIAIARDLPPETIGAAGIILGLVLVLFGMTGASRVVTKVFALPLVRGLQLGVGLILIRAAVDLVGPSSRSLAIAGAVMLALVIGTRIRRALPLALLFCVGGILLSLIGTTGLPALELHPWQPDLDEEALDLSLLMSALVLLVLPQIPLTLGNAVVAVVDLEHRYFPLEARRVTPARISLSCRLANVATGLLAGMPMCHGSGGLTAHHRAGARSFRMNVLIGSLLLFLGLFLGPTSIALLALIPTTVLAGLLAFTGVFHSGLVASERGFDLVVALVVGVLGLLTTNLAIGLAAGAALYWPRELLAGRGLEAPARP